MDDESPEDAAMRAAELAEFHEIVGETKWKYRAMFQVPKGKWKIGSIWEQAYLDAAQHVLKGVLSGELRTFTASSVCFCSATTSNSN